MAIIFRPPKALGNANFADEVAQGKPDIIDVELDGDVNPLYNLQHGNIDTTNLADAAEIKYTQLHRPIGIQASDITGTLPATIITPGSITNVQIGVAQTTWALGQLRDTPGISIGTTEQLLGELVWSPASRGGYYLAMGRLSGQISFNANENVTITINLKTEGNAGDVTGNLRDQSIQTLHFLIDPGVFGGASLPWSVTLTAVAVLNGVSRVKLTGQTTAPVASGFGLTAVTRALRAWELA